MVYFERCIDSLMPPHRLRNPFCKSNRYNSALRSYNMPAILAKIDEIREEPDTPEGPDGRKKLVDLLCPADNSSERWYRWNFTPLLRPDRKNAQSNFGSPPGPLRSLMRPCGANSPSTSSMALSSFSIDSI